MAALRPANLALKFLLELAALASFAVWAAGAGDGALSVLAALAAAGGAALAWGVLAAPRSPRRLQPAARVPFELGVFALAAAALVAAGHAAAGLVFAVAAVVNALLLGAFGDWDA